MEKCRNFLSSARLSSLVYAVLFSSLICALIEYSTIAILILHYVLTYCDFYLINPLSIVRNNVFKKVDTLLKKVIIFHCLSHCCNLMALFNVIVLFYVFTMESHFKILLALCRVSRCDKSTFFVNTTSKFVHPFNTRTSICSKILLETRVALCSCADRLEAFLLIFFSISSIFLAVRLCFKSCIKGRSSVNERILCA